MECVSQSCNSSVVDDAMRACTAICGGCDVARMRGSRVNRLGVEPGIQQFTGLKCVQHGASASVHTV